MDFSNKARINALTYSSNSICANRHIDSSAIKTKKDIKALVQMNKIGLVINVIGPYSKQIKKAVQCEYENKDYLFANFEIVSCLMKINKNRGDSMVEQMNFDIEEMSEEEREEFDMIPDFKPKHQIYDERDAEWEESLEESMLMDFEAKNPLLERNDEHFFNAQGRKEEQQKENPVETKCPGVRTGVLVVKTREVNFWSDYNEKVYPSLKNKNFNVYTGNSGKNACYRDWNIESQVAKNNRNRSEIYVTTFPSFLKDRESGDLYEDYQIDTVKGYLLNGKNKEEVKVSARDMHYYKVYLNNQAVIVVPVTWYKGRYIFDRFDRWINKQRSISRSKLAPLMKDRDMRSASSMTDFVYFEFNDYCSQYIHTDEIAIDEVNKLTLGLREDILLDKQRKAFQEGNGSEYDRLVKVRQEAGFY